MNPAGSCQQKVNKLKGHMASGEFRVKGKARMRKGKIGIVANPEAGRDIRRLVAHASVFDNQEKVNIIERMISAFDRLGLESILYMPDSFGIVERALDRIPHLKLNIEPLKMPLTHSEEDSTVAGALFQGKVDLIIIVGGDGTDRAVVKGLDLKDPTPIFGISTGTNNVFSSMLEATTAAIASWAIASNSVKKEEATRREKMLKLKGEDWEDLALIDIVFSSESFIGSKALWQPDTIQGIFSSRAEISVIGFSSLVGLFAPSSREDPFGSYALIGSPGKRVLFPIAPGKLVETEVKSFGKIYEGVPFLYESGQGTVALDGERKIEVLDRETFEINLFLKGPLTVDVGKALKLARERELFKINNNE